MKKRAVAVARENVRDLAGITRLTIKDKPAAENRFLSALRRIDRIIYHSIRSTSTADHGAHDFTTGNLILSICVAILTSHSRIQVFRVCSACSILRDRR
jgi:hypothetical protein